MSSVLKKKTVNYRRCMAEAPATDTTPAKFNLQTLVDDAKNSPKNPRPWMRKIGVDGARSQFLAHLVSKQGCTCGTLVICEDNRLIPLVDAESDGSTWEGTMEPKDASGHKRKFQEQVLFFALKENHVAVLQSKELSISDLQDFLVWFIQSRAELAEGWLFVLQNLPSSSAFQKLKDHDIKGIKIGKNAFSVVKTPDPVESPGKRQHYNKAIKVDPMVMGWLRQLTKNDALLDELEKSKDPGSIYVALEISYKSRSEKDAKQVMQALAATLGGDPEMAPEIRLDGKSKIKGDELTITGSVDVQAPGGNLSADDAMTRVADWLNESIKSGKVLS